MEAINNSDHDSDSLFKPLSEFEITEELPKDIASNALSIIIDTLNSIAGGVIITDLSGIIHYANPCFCKMFDCSVDDISGISAADLFSTNEVRTFSDVICMLDVSRDKTGEFIVERKNGEKFFVEISASNVTSVSGKVVGRMASFLDITRRKEVEADREELIKKLQEALDKINTLRSLIPICTACKKIRDDAGYWNEVESYIKKHSDDDFSYGLCPECKKELYHQL